MRSRKSYLAVAAVFVLVAAACGGDSGDSGDAGANSNGATTTTAAESNGGTSETTSAPDDGGSQTDDPPEVGEAGSFTVNGTEFAVTLLNRCIPFSDGPGNIDLQALAQGQGAKLNLYQAGDFTEPSVDGSGLRELFGSDAFGRDPVISESVVGGDRWTGSATVADSRGSGDTVDLTWDVMIPDEIRDCSL